MLCNCLRATSVNFGCNFSHALKNLSFESLLRFEFSWSIESGTRFCAASKIRLKIWNILGCCFLPSSAQASFFCVTHVLLFLFLLPVIFACPFLCALNLFLEVEIVTELCAADVVEEPIPGLLHSSASRTFCAAGISGASLSSKASTSQNPLGTLET